MKIFKAFFYSFLIIETAALYAEVIDPPEPVLLPEAVELCLPEPNLSFKMITIPGHNYAVLSTEVPQSLYNYVMEIDSEDNPAKFCNGDNPPQDSISWYDTIVFCNKLSLVLGKTPAYSVDGSVNPDDWDYEPHCAAVLTKAPVEWNKEADGFRLLTEAEWEFAAAAGQSTEYSGSNDPDEIAWYRKNSGQQAQSCGLKKPNQWGIYDMSGNLWEWVWDKHSEKRLYRVLKGGSCSSDKNLCKINQKGHHYPSRNALCYSYLTFGFRIGMNIR